MKSTHPLSSGTRNANRGAALVIILAFLVLLTGLVLAFFSRAITERQVSNSSASQTKADLLARGAMEIIVGDLKQEIVVGSSPKVVNGVTIYEPSSNAFMVPAQSGTATIPNLIRESGTVTAAISVNGNAIGVGGGPLAVSSTTSSANGRSVNLNRWNSHYLIPRLNANSTAIDNTPISSFKAPYWVMVTNQGPTVLATPNNSVIGRYAYAIYNEGGLLDINVAGYPSSMPASVAPHPGPNSLNLSDFGYARKGGIAFADLTQLPLTGTTQLDNLLGWRNYASSQPTGALETGYQFDLASAARYYDSVLSNSTGNLAASGSTYGTPPRTDQIFTSRQALLKFQRATNYDSSGNYTGAGISQNVLQYLCTFSQGLNAPSWEPRSNASALGGSDSGVDIATGTSIPNAYAYQANADETTAVNRRLYNVRVSGTFTRLDGTVAVPGEPLIKSRFDLSKLGWISSSGTLSAARAADIKNFFGLSKNSDGSWTYNHDGPGNGIRIMTLEEVSKANREPDFFELLQAGILKGSLGLCSGDPSSSTNNGSGGEFYRATQIDWHTPLVRTDDYGPVYAQEKYQVIQIAANLIDQFDADSYPTEIVLNGEHFYGIENLPYINAVADTALRPPPGGVISPNVFQAYVHRWLTMSLWNPHQNAGNTSSTSPVSFRIFTNQGQITPTVHNLPTAFHPQIPPWTLTMEFSGTNAAWLDFNITDYPGRFSEPTTLDPAYCSVTVPIPGMNNLNNPNGLIQTPLGWKRAGIYMGYSYSPDNAAKVPLCDSHLLPPGPPNTEAPKSVGYNAGNFNPATIPPQLELQYQDSKKVWHTYQKLRGLVYWRDARGDPYMEPNDPAWAQISGTWNKQVNPFAGPLTSDQDGWVTAFLDPRAVRLNLAPRQGLRLAENFGSNPADNVDSFPIEGPHFPSAALGPKYWRLWVNNSATTGSTSYYTDRDYVRRVGDAAGWAGADPQPVGNNLQRPLILDRPFRSVSEIGYAFRDDAWKSLNLISATSQVTGTSGLSSSADAGLLDVFCVGPTPAARSPIPGMTTGKLNINVASAQVLQTLLASTARDYKAADPVQINTTISSGDAQGIAADIVAKIKASGPLFTIGELARVFPQDSTTSSKYSANKSQREAMMRALADSCGTRTWNLMVDIIAQSGKFGPNAGSLKNFVVEGEAHYWLHLAMDRFTGQIVGQQLELVSE